MRGLLGAVVLVAACGGWLGWASALRQARRARREAAIYADALDAIEAQAADSRALYSPFTDVVLDEVRGAKHAVRALDDPAKKELP